MDNIKEIYQKNIEIEGILRVIEQRDSKEARELLAARFNELADAVRTLLAEPAADCAAQAEPQVLAPAASETTYKETSVPETTAETVMSGMPSGATAQASDDSRQKTIKLDEMLSARQSADLSKAFTLNDKYRFRRELFAGSDQDFSHTVNLISSMDSFDEARDYLLHDLCWDPRGEAAEDFLNIIRRHFQA
ncbi:MAG: hypothetical protein K2F74_03505 [Muribaculaceae bacterium]|nr:hypothetical protein [Muribaculaceae bacterium]MDE6130639.1 hypothetical protein [Muribaculaceae bacterium]